MSLFQKKKMQLFFISYEVIMINLQVTRIRMFTVQSSVHHLLWEMNDCAWYNVSSHMFTREAYI
jgi:hypothetical protein